MFFGSIEPCVRSILGDGRRVRTTLADLNYDLTKQFFCYIDSGDRRYYLCCNATAREHFNSRMEFLTSLVTFCSDLGELPRCTACSSQLSTDKYSISRCLTTSVTDTECCTACPSLLQGQCQTRPFCYLRRVRALRLHCARSRSKQTSSFSSPAVACHLPVPMVRERQGAWNVPVS